MSAEDRWLRTFPKEKRRLIVAAERAGLTVRMTANGHARFFANQTPVATTGRTDNREMVLRTRAALRRAGVDV